MKLKGNVRFLVKNLLFMSNIDSFFSLLESKLKLAFLEEREI
jgi:hypothetical protein